MDPKNMSDEQLEGLLTFEWLADKPKMPLVDQGDKFVRKLIEHVAKGYAMEIEPEDMAQTVFEHIAESPEGIPAIMLMACIMKAGRSLHEYRETARVAKTN